MEQNEKESDNIELRSEKVRNVIGKVPPRLNVFPCFVIHHLLKNLTHRVNIQKS